jgi:DNA-binding NtrC family response regulator
MLTAAIIDDQDESIQALYEHLKTLQVDIVATGHNGKDALEICRNHRPDVLFLDLQMPEYDGLYALKEISALDRQTVIVVMVDGDQIKTEMSLAQFRPAHILPKPFSISELSLIVKRMSFPKHVDKAKIALVSYVIEQSLLKVSSAAVQEVGDRLFARYGCYFSDCLEHPEYLKSILHEIFGNGATAITDTIKESLADFEEQKPISLFLSIMCR